MQNKLLYEYAVVRLVPKVEREEFINIGVILLCKKVNYLKIKYVLDQQRIVALSREVDIEDIKDYLCAWEHVCEGGTKGGTIGKLEIRVRFRWLTANRSTIIQSSPVHPGLCIDPDNELDHLMEKFVFQH